MFEDEKKYDGGTEGFTLIEVMIALLILLVVLLGIATSQISAIKGNVRAFHIDETLNVLQDKVEDIYNLPYDDSLLDEGTHTESSPPAGYTASWIVTDGDDAVTTKTVSNTKEIVVTVTRTLKPEVTLRLSTVKSSF